MWSNYSKTEAVPRSGCWSVWNFCARFSEFISSGRPVMASRNVDCFSPGCTPGNSCGSVPPGSPNPDPISDQKMWFSTPVYWPLRSIPVLRPGDSQQLIIYHCWDWNTDQKIFLTSKENERIYSHTVVVPSKTILDSRPTWIKSIPVFTPRRGKPLPVGAAHTNMAYFSQVTWLSVSHGYWILCQG